MNANIDAAGYLHVLLTGREIPADVPAQERLGVAMAAAQAAAEAANLELVQEDLDELVALLGGDDVPDAAARVEAAAVLRRMLVRLEALGTGDDTGGEG